MSRVVGVVALAVVGEGERGVGVEGGSRPLTVPRGLFPVEETREGVRAVESARGVIPPGMDTVEADEPANRDMSKEEVEMDGVPPDEDRTDTPTMPPPPFSLVGALPTISSLDVDAVLGTSPKAIGPTRGRFHGFPPNLMGLLLLQSCCTASSRDRSSDEIQLDPIGVGGSGG